MKKLILLFLSSLMLTGCMTPSTESHSTGWGSKNSDPYEPFNTTIIPNDTIPTEGREKKTYKFITNSFTGQTAKKEQDVYSYIESGQDLLADIYFYNDMNLSLAPISIDVPGGLELGKSTGQSGYFSFKFAETVDNISIKCRAGFNPNPFSMEAPKVGIYNMGVIPLKNDATKSSEVTFDEYNFTLETTNIITIYSLTGRVVIESISYWK